MKHIKLIDTLNDVRADISNIELFLLNESILDEVVVEKLKSQLRILKTIDFQIRQLIEMEG